MWYSIGVRHTVCMPFPFPERKVVKRTLDLPMTDTVSSRNSQLSKGANALKKFLVMMLVMMSIMTATTAATANSGTSSRTWKTVAYNPYLSLHSCACPGMYHLGQKLRLHYHGKTWSVVVTDTGPYFDISAGGMNYLASTSQGLIHHVKVTSRN